VAQDVLLRGGRPAAACKRPAGPRRTRGRHLVMPWADVHERYLCVGGMHQHAEPRIPPKTQATLSRPHLVRVARAQVDGIALHACDEASRGRAGRAHGAVHRRLRARDALRGQQFSPARGACSSQGQTPTSRSRGWRRRRRSTQPGRPLPARRGCSPSRPPAV